MTEPSDQAAPRRGFFARHPAIHFLWAGPLAIVCSLWFFFLAMLNVCGISGCGGGGYGVSRGDPAETAMYVAVGSLVMMLPIGVIPWLRNRAARATVMLVLALAVGGTVWGGISQ